MRHYQVTRPVERMNQHQHPHRLKTSAYSHGSPVLRAYAIRSSSIESVLENNPCVNSTPTSTKLEEPETGSQLEHAPVDPRATLAQDPDERQRDHDVPGHLDGRPDGGKPLNGHQY